MASKEIIAHYMDPRNFLGVNSVFQFLEQSYDGNIQTLEGVKKIIAGTFMENGRIYVLDSLPRAIAGEKSGYPDILRSVYPVAQEKKAFDSMFESSRIRETVIRLQVRDQAVWAAADTEEKAKLLKLLILYGPGVLMIAAP